jgi:hypothetical protein
MKYLHPVFLPVLLLCSSLAAEAQIRYTEAEFSFTIPQGWAKIPDTKIEAFNSNKPAAYRFQGGLMNEASTAPKAYLLIQDKKNEPEALNKILIYQKTALPADPFSIISDVIEKKEYLMKSEFYSKEYDAFVTITVNGGKFSILVKKFSDPGYVLLHFYLSMDPKSDLKQIEAILKSFTLTHPIRVQRAPQP